MLKLFKNHSYKFLWGAIFVYIILFSFFCLKKYYNFDYSAFDLAIFNQVFFNTAEGRWFDMTINLNSYLADHFTPIIFLLLPIYKLIPRPETLLILQTIILALSAWPLYKIASCVTKNNLFALSTSLLWLCNPFVHNANIFEFHLLPLAVFFLFWTFYFYQKNNFKLFILFLVLSLLVREDIALILLGFLPLAILDKKNLRWKLSSLFLPSVYFVFSILIISSFSGQDSYKFVVYYSWLLNIFNQPIAVIVKIFSLSNIFNFLVISLPLLFVPFFRIKYFWLLCLPLLQFILSANGFSPVIYNTHYSLLLMPAVFIAFIFAWPEFIKQKHIKNNKSFFKIIFFIITLYFLIYLSPVKSFFNNENINQDIKQDFVEMIDDEASLMTDLSMAAQLSSRSEIYPLHYSYFAKGQFGAQDFELPLVDYILIDYNNFFDTLADLQSSPFFSIKNPASNFRKLLKDYSLIKAQDNMFLFASQNGQDDLAFYDFSNQETRNDNFVDSYNLAKTASSNILKINFNKKAHQNNNYLMRFYKNDKYFDLPLDYGVLDTREWQGPGIVSFYYYLSKDVDSWQVFIWQGESSLGNLKQLVVDMELEPMTDIISIDKL
jgi:uncharacterized membrane protein